MASHEAGALHAQVRAPAWLPLPDDVNDLLQPIWPSTVVKDTEGLMHIGGLAVTAIAAQVGTPVYVIDEADFRTRAKSFVQAFDQAFASLAGAEVSYAGKALLTVGIACWVAQDGLNIDVCSEGEWQIARLGGIDAKRITFHGNVKTDHAIEVALSQGVGRVVLDSLHEVDQVGAIAARLGVKAPVMLRCSVGVEAHTHEYIATSHEDQKFGLALADGTAFEAARRVLLRPELELLGVHSHIGSQIFDTEAYALTIGRFAAFAARVKRDLGHSWSELGLGGGFGVAYTCGHDPLPPGDIAQAMAQQVERACRDYDLPLPRVSVEPGRAIAAPSGISLYTVGVVKDVTLDGGLSRLYVAVDGGMSDNVRTALYGADYSATLASRRSPAGPRLARIVGKHCESGDILVKDEYMPADVTVGDLVAVPVTGAYCRSLASNYNQAGRPPVVAVKDGQLQTLLRRETIDDLLALDQDA
ncbi:MAG: diaminopimelate decarboxylase [Micrococcales bacterium]|nr:diaminopimelate decarboxylase [Micrococcales bacterium]